MWKVFVRLLSCFIVNDSKRKAMRHRWLGRCDRSLYIDKVPKIQKEVLKRIGDRYKRGEVIKVRIIIYWSSLFSLEGLYEEFSNDPRFDIKVIVSPLMSYPLETRIEDYERTVAFFRKKNIDVIPGFDFRDGSSFDLAGDRPDIIFYQAYSQTTILENFRIKTWYDKALCIGVPYGYMIANCAEWQFNEPFHNLVWLNCEETIAHKELAEKYAINKGRNALATGYTKFDAMARKGGNPDRFWKTTGKTRIIWAPHHSINTGTVVDFATFDRYWRTMLDFVKASPDIEVVMKPHPGLKPQCVRIGLMSGEDFENYVGEWNSLPNASVYSDGDYMDLFTSSDAIVLDSMSFIPEYMVTGKPICFTSKWDGADALVPHFNEFGKRLIPFMTIARDWAGIAEFIGQVRNGTYADIPGKDEFVDKYLRLNYGHAGRFIADHIRRSLSICE